MAELYYDRYEGDSEHRRAGYTKVLAKAGYVEQSAEFNEIQSISRDYIERLGDSLYRDGYIVTGCGININGTQVTIEDGRVYLEGLVRLVNGVELTITGQGTERIIAKVITTIVTPDYDRSLYDPAQNAENYGLPGADRQKQVVLIYVVQGDDFDGGAELYHLEDGEVVNEDSNDENAYMMDILAERTFDENGSYKVSGLVIRDLLEIDEETGKVKAYVTEGKAYVKGYSVTKNVISTIYLEPSLERRTVTSESHYYNSQFNRYELSNGPIADVLNLTCLVSIVGERKFRGSIHGGYDPLNNVPVDSISRVYTLDGDGNIGTVYKQGRDYKLYNDQVDWGLTGDDAQEPEAGTTYYVDYVYNKTMIRGVDYDIENSASTAYLKFLDGGDKPDENSRMYISYEYTLSRRDLVLIDRYGHLSIIQGKPDRLKSLITPFNGSDQYLELGYINIYPIDELTGEPLEGIGEVVNYNSVRLTQEDFYIMLKRLDTIEDDLAILDMEREILDGEDDASLNGLFTDNFKNINKSDLSYTGVDAVTGEEIKYTASIDPDLEELTTCVDIFSDDAVIDPSTSSPYAVYGEIISAPYVYEKALSQPYATGFILVNPYASYGPLCKIVLNPSSDNWVDEKTTQVTNTITKATYTNSTVYRDEHRNTINGRDTQADGTKNSHLARGTFLGTEDGGSVTSKLSNLVTTNTTSSVAYTVYEYMRTKTIAVTGTAFSGGTQNIYCIFNNKPINLTATGSTIQGSNKTINGVTVTTVNADPLGNFTAKFTIPSKTPCGTVSITFTGTDAVGFERTGVSSFTATGTLKTTTITNTKTITERYQVLKTYINVYSVDPIAQSFMLSTVYDRVLMKIGIYFASKSTTRPVVVQVRNMVNGYPGELVYAETEVKPASVNIPSNPKVPVVTEVVLQQPVYCKANTAYCFVVLSDCNEYSLYYAEMGKKLLNSSSIMSVNPYETGVMFSSSNSSTWTAHQASDLKFDLYRSRYTGKGEIHFNDVPYDAITSIFLDAAYEDNNNAGLDWYYRYLLPGGRDYSEWFPIDTLTYRDLRDVTTKVSLKAIMNTDYSTSPYIDIGRVTLRALVDKKTATYISEHITADDFEDDPYQQMKINYLAALPSGADHTIYYMDDYYGDWVKVETGPYVTLTTKVISEEFTQYIWNINKVHKMLVDPTSPGATFFKFRIDLNTTLSYNRPRIRTLSVIFKYAL